MKKKNDSPVNPPEPDVLSRDEKFLKKFRDVIEEVLSDSEQEFSIDALRRKLLMGRTGFFEKVKAATGKSPNQYIISYRLERAAQLLEKNYGKIIDVAVEVGFSSPQYFATCFKEEFGQTPGEFLRSIPKKDSDKPQDEFRIEQFDRSLMAARRKFLKNLIGTDEQGTPQREDVFKLVMQRYALEGLLDDLLDHYTELECAKKFKQMLREAELNQKRLSGNILKYLEFYYIIDEPMRRNALSAAAVCMAEDILPGGSGNSKLRVKHYGETFNLHENEHFIEQPIAAGRMGTGILVGRDVILTAAHLINENNITELRFIFDFMMPNPDTPVTEVPDAKIYSGIEILHRIHNPDADWALVKLNREVADREVAVMSRKEIFDGQPVYITGHPCGLPLKLEQGAKVGGITDSYFKSDLNIYGGSGGSPVFCAETHELIGIVSRAKVGDFMWTGKGWLSLPIPKADIITEGSRCTRVSAIDQYIGK